MKRVAYVVAGIIALVAVGYLLGTITDRRAPPTVASSPSTSTATTANLPNQSTSSPRPSELSAAPAGFTIVSVDDNSIKAITRALSTYSVDELAALPWNKRATANAAITNTITQAQILPTLEAILANLRADDPDLDEITVFLYSEPSGVGSGWDIGSALWAPRGERGNVTPEIASSNDRATYLTTIEAKPNIETYLATRTSIELRQGLTVEQRRAFYLDMSRAEVRAFADADARINPNTDVMGNMRLSNELREQYRAEVVQAHGVSPADVGAILLEGQQMNWPMR